jgi:secreted PhoX family phosphatase
VNRSHRYREKERSNVEFRRACVNSIKGQFIKQIEYESDKAKVYSDPGTGEKMAAIMARRFSRRGALGVAAGTAAVVLGIPYVAAQSTPTASPAASPASQASPAASPVATTDSLSFGGLGLGSGEVPAVPAGYTVVPFLRWGDPLFSNSPAFDPLAQSASVQALQIGYNCDCIGFIPLPIGSGSVDHGLLRVNHEYTNPELMFPAYLKSNPEYDAADVESAEFLANPTKDIVDTELEAHGMSFIEIRRDASGTWSVVIDGEYNRRITATTPIALTGPAAGAVQLKTSVDPTGLAVVGTLNNCAGGITPWGTVITGEENFNQYFANLGNLKADDPLVAIQERYGLPDGPTERLWETFYDRFDLTKEPNEPLRFGWGVEIDPFDPKSTPKKRTSLGRNKHEGHTSAVAKSGQVVIYGGGDERFEYAYKFVTSGSYNVDDRAANMDLLDDGTLYVLRGALRR